MRSAGKMVSLLIWAASLASTAPGATITGTVKGPDGSPFQGAFVQAQNPNTQSRNTVSVLSDKQGRYRLENLPAGQFRLQIRAIGYKAEPRTGVKLAADQSVSFDWALQKGTVRWSDLAMYQGRKLLPDAKGKDVLFGSCFACHGFQSRMAAVRRDEAGWMDRVNYMLEMEHYFIGDRVSPQQAVDVASYLNSVFGVDSQLPESPADLPEYQSVVRPPYSDEAMKIVYVEYNLPGPNRMPWSGAIDKDGIVWIPYYGKANKIGRLDPKTGEVKEFAVPNIGTAGIHSAVAGPDGSVWISQQGSNKLAKLDPKTGTVIEYQDAYLPGNQAKGIIPGRLGSKHTVRIDPRGMVWSSGEPVTAFSPETGKFTRYAEIPTTYGVEQDQLGNMWFTEMTKDGKIVKLDTKTGKITKYATPGPNPHRITVDSQGVVWFDFAGTKIGRFDPKTEAFKEYELPPPAPSPYAIATDKQGQVWYSNTNTDEIGRLDPATGHVTVFPFTHAEITMREFLPDSQGRIWFGSPANNVVGYFYLAGDAEHGGK